MNHSIVEPQNLQQLFDALCSRGYKIMGPKVQDGAIVYDELAGASALPIGWTDEQDNGAYRLKKRNDNAVFGYTSSPHSWKKFLHTPYARLWNAKRTPDGFLITDEPENGEKMAFIGVRPCELQAIAILDKVLMGKHDGIFIVAVNCVEAGNTCFCSSMNTGPKAMSGYDLVLTEIISVDSHYFVVDTGSSPGAEIMEQVAHKKASAGDLAAAENAITRAAGQMGRTLDTNGIRELLYQNHEHQRWDNAAGRCLSCGNCTMVCPTCFCTTVEDVTDLTGQAAERQRRWDSCFTMDFSYIHGGSIRATPKSRYRQWITHKLAAWIDQFGASGCVGCGRCITWCPVGIDITEEIRAIRESVIESTGGKFS